MPVSLATYERVALEDDEAWEWRHGRLVKKPGGTHARNHTMGELMFAIHRQLDQQGIDDDYQFRVNFRTTDPGRVLHGAGRDDNPRPLRG